MKQTRSATVWLTVALLGAGAGHALWGKLPLDAHSIVLVVLGGFLATGTAFAWQVLRRLDELKNVAGLDQERRELLSRRVESRRGPMIRRWIASILTGIASVGEGQLLKTSLGVQHQWGLILLGYGALAVGVVTVVLLVMEYQKLSQLGPALNRELKRIHDEQSFLRKVRA